jgi:hypothetical protein
MSGTKWTPGPLRVVQPDKWPFDILTVDSDFNEVFVEGRHAYSSLQKTVADVMRAHGFPHAEREDVIATLERQVADAHLRAAAPELYEALNEFVEHFGDPFRNARAALARARGEKP